VRYRSNQVEGEQKGVVQWRIEVSTARRQIVVSMSDLVGLSCADVGAAIGTISSRFRGLGKP
jgi:hypothetical protein